MPATHLNPQIDALAASRQHDGFVETRAPKISDKNLIRDRGLRAIRAMQERSERNGNCNMTLDEINAIIAETRRERTESEKQAASVCAQQAVREIREQSEKNGNCNMTMDEINAVIYECRREHREKELELNFGIVDNEAKQIVRELQGQARNAGVDKMTMAEINAEIAACRREKKEI